MALSVHPGAVATEQQRGAAEGGAYGLAGKVLVKASEYLFMSAEQGSESAVWAGTAPSVAERREEAQGRYFTEADGKVGIFQKRSYADIVRSELRRVRRRMMISRGSFGI